MSAFVKVLILMALNFSAMIFLIWRLIKAGNNYSQALRNAWEWIMVQNGVNSLGNRDVSGSWVMILSKTWWLMLIVFGITWVNSPELGFTLILIILILIHVYWFFRGHVFQTKQFNRIINLNHNWGVIYKEVDERSGLASKTLAELDLRKKNLLVLAIERRGRFSSFPKGLEALTVGDRIIMFGELYFYHSIFENGIESGGSAPEYNE